MTEQSDKPVIEWSHRARWIGCISLFAGAAIGEAIVIAHWALETNHKADALLVGALTAALAGSALGLLCTPAVMMCCRCKDLMAALTSVYGATFAVSLLAGSVCHPLAAASLVVVVHLSLCMLARFVFPDTHMEYQVRRCPKCGYDLRQVAHITCPECGMPSREFDRSSGRFTHRRMLMVVGESAQGNHRAIGVFAVIASAIVLLFLARATSPHFSPGRFRRINAGMDAGRVTEILGKPDDRLGRGGHREIWRYYEQGVLKFAYEWDYEVYFTEGVVDSTASNRF